MFSFETTLYWNPNLSTDKKGKSYFSFFTNDIKSDFIIIAQGIDVKNIKPLWGKQAIKVE